MRMVDKLSNIRRHLIDAWFVTQIYIVRYDKKNGIGPITGISNATLVDRY